jgi:hypothetical protein
VTAQDVELLAFFLVVALAVGVGIIAIVRSGRTPLRQISRAIGGSVSGGRVRANHGGTPFECRFHPQYPGDNTGTLSVMMTAPSIGSFEIRREAAFDRLAKGSGFSEEVQTGDEEFARDFYVTTGDEAFTANVLASQERRAAVRTLLQAGAWAVEHDGSVVRARWISFTIAPETHLGFITAAVSELALLAQGIRQETHAAPAGARAAKVRRWWRQLVPIVGCSPVIVGFPILVVAHIGYGGRLLQAGQLFASSLTYSVPAFVLVAGAAFFALKGRSSSHTLFLVVFASALVGLPATGYGIGVLLDVWLDHSAPVQRTAVVVGKRYVPGNRWGPNRYVTLRSWRSDGVRARVEVDVNDYARVTAGRTRVIVFTMPGWLGYEWVAAYTIVDDRQ